MENQLILTCILNRLNKLDSILVLYLERPHNKIICERKTTC